jgi:hypothetical protein
MPNLDTNLSVTPFFDDYVPSKNYYQILYRPAVAVQARELNQMQTILQDQINQFGKSIYKDGSVVEGCAFSFFNNYDYVKINDNFIDNSAIPNVTNFISAVATNENGLTATILNASVGYQSQDPDLNTLYINYENSTVFPNGSIQSVFSAGETLALTTSANLSLGSVTVASTTNSTGKGYAFTTSSGVIFKKGYFIRVAEQTLIVSKYDNKPDDISIGFNVDETIISPTVDTSLFDNAAGSSNYNAPGAYRLKLVPVLTTRQTSSLTDTNSFFSLCDFKNGLPVSIKNDPQYSALGKDQARRTYETNGDYVVNPFSLSVVNKYQDSGSANTTYLNVSTSPGIAYVKGYRVEFINDNYADIRK